MQSDESEREGVQSEEEGIHIQGEEGVNGASHGEGGGAPPQEEGVDAHRQGPAPHSTRAYGDDV